MIAKTPLGEIKKNLFPVPIGAQIAVDNEPSLVVLKSKKYTFKINEKHALHALSLKISGKHVL